MNEPTNYEKGLSFEEQFAEYMKTELGYDKVRIRKAMMSNSNSKGHEADIIGIIEDPRYDKARTIGLLFLTVGVFGTLACLFDIVPIELMVVFLVFIFGAAVFAILKQSIFLSEYAWAECKKRKAKTNYEQIRSFIDKISSNNASKDKKHRINHRIYVSATGFVNNAHELAHENSIRCFVANGNGFEEVKYWK